MRLDNNYIFRYIFRWLLQRRVVGCEHPREKIQQPSLCRGERRRRDPCSHRGERCAEAASGAAGMVLPPSSLPPSLNPAGAVLTHPALLGLRKEQSSGLIPQYKSWALCRAACRKGEKYFSWFCVLNEYPTLRYLIYEE